MNTHTRKDYAANAVEDDKGNIVAISIGERIITEKVDAAGRVRDRDWDWYGDVFVVPVKRAANLASEIIETIAYYASGEAAQDRIDYPPRAINAEQDLELKLDKATKQKRALERKLKAVDDELAELYLARIGMSEDK